jgi:HYR domain
MRRWLSGCIIALLALSSTPLAAQEVTIAGRSPGTVSVNMGLAIDCCQFAGVSWSQGAASNVSVFAYLGTDFGGSLGFQLSTAIGPAATASDLIRSTSVVVNQGQPAWVLVFTGLNLPAGTYYLTGHGPRFDNGAFWSGFLNPTVVGSVGSDVAVGTALGPNDPTEPFRRPFGPLVTSQFGFLVNGTPGGGGTPPSAQEPDWTQKAPADSPTLRGGGHRMVYDAARGEVVLFGGTDGTGFRNDTWVWDGTNWTQKSPANSPTPRYGNVVYDAARGEVVLFGDLGGGALFNDTWVWDGTNWTQKSPANRPTPRTNHAMAYDAGRGEVVLFGGYEVVLLDSGYTKTAGPRNDTWVWDGTNWTQKSPANRPTPRDNHAMAYDVARGEAVLFGGGDNVASFYDDTWVWDGTNWTQKSPAHRPAPGWGHAMAYDAARGQVVLFGGLNSTSYQVGTWVWAAGSSSPSGSISVTTNLSGASFSITGPANYSGSGTSFSQSDAAAGTYTITYGAVTGHVTPPTDTGTLTAGGTLAFVGTYGVQAPDTTAPVLSLPTPFSVEATGPTGALVEYAVSAFDPDDAVVQVLCSPSSGSRFPLGTTSVQCTASDLAGNTSTGAFAVTVHDTTPPTISSIQATPTTIPAKNNTVTAVTLQVTATDLVAPEPTCSILAVTASVPVATPINFNGLTTYLPANRGEIFSLSVRCHDSAGNSATRVVVVPVTTQQVGTGTGYVLTIDGMNDRSILKSDVPPDYTRYLYDAFGCGTDTTNADWCAKIQSRVGPIDSFTWSRNIYDTDQAVNDLRVVLEGLTALSHKSHGPLIVVAHSWGTVLAYVAISQNPKVDVTKLVTLGSPLNAQNGDVSAYTRGVLAGMNINSVGALKNVKSWANYWESCDPISGSIPLVGTQNIAIDTDWRDAWSVPLSTCHEAYFRDYNVWLDVLLYVYLTK